MKKNIFRMLIGIVALVFLLLLSACSNQTQQPSNVSDGLTSVENADVMDAAQAQIFDKADFEEYLKFFVQFFQRPRENGDSIPRNYFLAFYLLSQTFERYGEAYFQLDEDHFWIISADDLVQTANTYLGISNLDLSDIAIEKWPFWGHKENVYYRYALETEYPYANPTILSVSYDEQTHVVYADVLLKDDQYEKEVVEERTLRYVFSLEKDAGETIYALKTIQAL